MKREARDRFNAIIDASLKEVKAIESISLEDLEQGLMLFADKLAERANEVSALIEQQKVVQENERCSHCHRKKKNLVACMICEDLFCARCMNAHRSVHSQHTINDSRWERDEDEMYGYGAMIGGWNNRIDSYYTRGRGVVEEDDFVKDAGEPAEPDGEI